jgi:hypothetical protein
LLVARLKSCPDGIRSVHPSNAEGMGHGICNKKNKDGRAWQLDCLRLAGSELVRTLSAWKAAHPGVNILAFEANSDKAFGFGHNEEVCGFCLASHYFEDQAPIVCKFCRAQLRETHVISELPEIVNRIYTQPLLQPRSGASPRPLPFIVKKRTELDR